MNQKKLVPCPSCDRHVFAGSCACPFCGTALTEACASKVESQLPRGRLRRAARMAAAATLLGATSCLSASAYGTNIPWDSGVDSDGDSADRAADSADDDAQATDDGPPRSDR